MRWTVCSQSSWLFKSVVCDPIPNLARRGVNSCYNECFVPYLIAALAAILSLFRSRVDIALEVLALRQQLAVLKRQRPCPPLTRLDRFFWTTLRRLWPRWSDVLVVVRPESVIGWHRAGFHLYWRWRSRPRSGRPKIDSEIRNLIQTMAVDNVGWCAPRIHGELLKLGFEVSERSVARCKRTAAPRGSGPALAYVSHQSV
jgi:hypothetical protein